jgi:hypothetical protein
MRTETDFIQSSYDPFLQDLLALVSVDCGTLTKAGVDRVGSWVGCAAWGWTVDLIPQSNYGDLG